MPLYGFLGIVALLASIGLGLPIFLAMLLVGLAGYSLMAGVNPAISMIGIIAYRETSGFVLSALPLFVLMGQIAGHGRLSTDAYKTANTWLGHFPGGLGLAAIVGCTGFAAVSGSTLASAAAMGSISIPEMRRYGYKPGFAAAIVACGGAMAAMIPPSIMMIVYGVFTHTSIGLLLIAGILPGLMQAIFYMAVIYVTARLKPAMAPPGPSYSWSRRLASLKDTWGILFLIVLIMGGIYSGVFTPTEAAALGAFAAFVIAMLRRGLTRENVGASLLETGRTTSMVFFIIIGASLFSHFLTLTGLPTYIVKAAADSGLPPHAVIVAILLVYIVLGCFLEAMAMVMLTLPIVFPVAIGLGFDPIWLGVMVVTMVEFAVITPPVGLNVYVIHGVVKDVRLGDIFKGIVPFFLADLVRLTLLVAFPQIALFLPGQMKA